MDVGFFDGLTGMDVDCFARLVGFFGFCLLATDIFCVVFNEVCVDWSGFAAVVGPGFVTTLGLVEGPTREINVTRFLIRTF